MRLVAALGGNALLRRGERPDPDLQRRRVRAAAAALSPLARRHSLAVTHGNGPQIGFLAAEARGAGGLPLDLLGAESEGMIGYWLEQELRNALPGREVATLLTEVEVDAGDPAFARPTKPIGPMLAREEGARLARRHGWSLIADGGGVRRAVASPLPRRIVPLRSIRRLLDDGAVVVCAGGGGIPVVRGRDDALRGAEAVVDKDHTAALLAEGVGAAGLLLLTDTGGVYEAFGTAEQRLIRTAAPEELDPGRFPPGSMAPKVAAACRFVDRTGGWAAIGALEDAEALATGAAGTFISRGYAGTARSG